MDESSIEIRISELPISIHRIEQSISAPECGGLAFFIGKVRQHTAGKKVLRLEFEAFESMAVKELQKIAQSIMEQWPVKRVAIYHRTGRLGIGETAVAIGIASPHRKEAFVACAYAIDTLKKTVPIWKKEVFEDGEVWVSAHP